jgi:hypothetical protein
MLDNREINDLVCKKINWIFGTFGLTHAFNARLVLAGALGFVQLQQQEPSMKIRRLRTSLMVSVSAIALIVGASIAAAQDRGGQSGGGGAGGQPQAPSAQPGGGENKGGGDVKGKADIAPKGDATPKGGQAEQRQDQKGDRKGERPQRAQDDDRKQRDQKGAQDQRDKDRDNRAQDKPDRKDSKDSASDKKSRDSTTGQGAAGRGGGSITAEQRTRITTTIRQSNVRPVTNVNFNIRVGSAIPRTVTLNPLPAAVIEVYPDWRGYRFILVGNDILVIDPDTYQIVAVLDA